jgi:hypothetical protein
MDTKVIPLRELQADAEGCLRRCCDSGESFVVELPDRRFVAIQPLDEDDDLVNDLIANNPAFRALLAKSTASPRMPFQPRALKDREDNKEKP